MTIKNILNIENNRSEDEYNLIHLFREGKWWSAYELSAFLCHNYKNNNSDKLKITKKYLKSENYYFIKVGLMETSFDKYLPNNQEYVNVIDDDHITINASTFIECDVTHLNAKNILDGVKESLSTMNKKTPKVTNELLEVNTHTTLLSILNDIMIFNVQNVTHEEMKDFILNLKDKTNETLLKMFL